MDSGKREKVAYLAALVQRGDLTCEEALAVSDETSSCQSRSTVVSAAGRKKGIDVARGGRENKPGWISLINRLLIFNNQTIILTQPLCAYRGTEEGRFS
jgi:hypothetical protein